MKPGTILMALGALIICFTAVSAYYVGLFNLSMLLLGVAGLILVGVGASRRWERARL